MAVDPARTGGIDRRGPARWVLSHQRRYPWMLLGFLGGSVIMVVLNSTIPGLIGWANLGRT